MSSTTATNSSSSISSQYMNLLITQLQNQNPLDPMDNNAMTSVLTGLSQLQQMESMSTSFASVLKTEQANQASSLIGKQVAFTASDDSTEQATVDGVTIANGTPTLSAGNYQISLDDVTGISVPQ